MLKKLKIVLKGDICCMGKVYCEKATYKLTMKRIYI